MRALLRVAVAIAAFALPAAAASQPPTGIVRPADEGSLSLEQLGAQLYAGNCASCHGSQGEGVTATAPQRGAGGIQGLGPPLVGVGAEAADFYLRTGYMPLSNPHEQPRRSRVLFSERELQALIGYVASFGGGPPVPEPHPEQGNVARGLELFTSHCAGCHQVVTEGGFVTGAVAPPLEDATAVQIAQAVRIGPFIMPSFSERVIPADDLDSIIAYVQASKSPHDAGGWGIGHLGPVPEGMVTWLLAAVLLVGLCVVIGTRLKA
ncbi:MAG TPA: c-type cytochrome [Gaiellaceae bacterium]|nr:c-type cytochrome [Gaiellaceae bacterium]